MNASHHIASLVLAVDLARVVRTTHHPNQEPPGWFDGVWCGSTGQAPALCA
jgi:hypothetical protein